MKKRIIRLLLSAVLICTMSVCLLSVTAFAAANTTLAIGSSASGGLALIENGVVTNKTTDNVSVDYDASTNTATLTLSGANLTHNYYMGSNVAGLHSGDLNRLHIILAPGTTNTIDVGYQGASVNAYLYGLDCSNTDITVSGSGTLNLKVNTCNSDRTAYGQPYNAYGIFAKSLTVEGNATLNVIMDVDTGNSHYAINAPTTVNNGFLSVDTFDKDNGSLKCFSSTVTLNGGSVSQKAARRLNDVDTNIAAAIATVSGDGLTSTTANGVTTYSLSHQWIYAVEGNVVRAWCTHPTSTGCRYYGESNALTLTLTAEDAPFHTERKSYMIIGGILVEYVEAIPYAARFSNHISPLTGAAVSGISYRDADGTTVANPTYPGNYTASITLTADGRDYTAESSFAITRTTLSHKAPQAISDLEWTGAAQPLVTAGSILDSWDGSPCGTLEYRLSAEDEWRSDVPTAAEIGSYSVYWRTVPTDSYQDWYDIYEAPQPISVAISAKTATGVSAKGYTGTYDGLPHSIAVTAPDTFRITYQGPDASDYSAENPLFTDAGEYEVAYKIEQEGYATVAGTETVKIEKRPVSVTGITVSDKHYDATDLANLDYSGVSISGVLPQDSLTVTAVGTYDDKNAGSNKPVILSNLTLVGAAAENYVLSDSGNQTETTGNILPRETSVIITPNGGTYEGVITPATAELTHAAGSETPVITLTYSGTAFDGTLYTECPDAPEDAGIYTVKAALDDANYTLIGSTEAVFTVDKAIFMPPALASLPYNGLLQLAAVPYSVDYEVISNEGGIDAGSYPVVLQLVDADNYRWSLSSDASVTLQFTITQAENSWDIAPAISDWTYGDAANDPVSAAKFGTATVEYRPAGGTDADYSAAVPAQAGNYLVRFSVPATGNYASLTQVEHLTIAAKTADLHWSSETALVYNGAAQHPAVTVTGLLGEDVCTAVVTGSGTDVGSYTATVTGLSNSNYQLPSEDPTQTFTITPKAAMVTAKNLRLHVGTSLPETAVLNKHYTLTGVVEGDSIGTVTVVYEKDGQVVTPNRGVTGTYDIVPVVTEANANYDISCVSGKLTYYYMPTPTYTPSVEDTVGGETEVSTQNPQKGERVTVMPAPDKGYKVGSITVTDSSGSSVKLKDNGNGTYTYVQPAGKVRICVIYVPAAADFKDVSKTGYYYDAVNWAVAEEITKGISDTAFGPHAACTRAQVVTFLWRAAGSPEPKGTDCAFTDVKAGSYYYKAVLWAVENGITTGTSDTTFHPDATVTRGQTVSFLWRAEPGRKTDGKHSFRDVQDTAYYHDAVIWAVENGITNGTGKTTFSPDAACTRAQIVTFLYRCLSENA